MLVLRGRGAGGSGVRHGGEGLTVAEDVDGDARGHAGVGRGVAADEAEVAALAVDGLGEPHEDGVGLDGGDEVDDAGGVGDGPGGVGAGGAGDEGQVEGVEAGDEGDDAGGHGVLGVGHHEALGLAVEHAPPVVVVVCGGGRGGR